LAVRCSGTARLEGIEISDLRQWLVELGLGKYAEVFAENEIELGDLPDLSEEDLRELGLPMGPRKRILGRACTLSRTGPSAEPAASDGQVGQSDPAPAGDAERRQLTVMFCDLVGSTELSQRLDPEDLREINRGYQDVAKAAIERYEGYVARYMGDGVLAYFGYPRAHEDDAERAIHAGLALVDAVANLNGNADIGNAVELEVRVGIATGPVVVGDTIGEGASQESAVIGETPNLAARLQGIAVPNSVVVASGTHALGAGRFEYENLGQHELKGIAEPVQAWRVIAPSNVEGRFEAVHRSGLTAFVGRDQEIALLLERWQAAKEGDGQVVLLSGEAGIGKSRIMQVLRNRLEDEPHFRLRHQCSPYHTSSALHPVIHRLELAAGFTAQDDAQQKLGKIENLLAQAAEPDAETMALFADMLSIPTHDRYPALDLSPQEQKDRTLRMLIDQLEGLCAKRPVFVVYEDTHWIDPTTSEVIDRMVDAAQNLPVLLLITFRPEFDCPWSGYPHTTMLALNRLTRSQTESVILNVAGGNPLPIEVADQITAKTDGIPLFVEELTKNVLESGLLKKVGGQYELTGPLAPLAIPASLQDSLMARLDRLAPVREVAQIGAAVGREFAYDLMQGITGKDEIVLRDALEQLTESELIFRRGTPPNATYVFKHALVQDAAYASMLKSRRQQLHASIAGVLKKLHPELEETQPELLAYHYTRAGLSEPAVEYWQVAAKRAISQSAYPEAIEQLDMALEQLAHLPPGRERDKRELELQVMKFGPLFPTKGYASPELVETSSRALVLGRTVGDNKTLFPTLYARWTSHYVPSEQTELLELSREYLERAIAEDDDAAFMVGHRLHATSLLFRGEVEKSRRHANEALQKYIPEQHTPLHARFGQDLKVTAITYVAICDALLGNVEDALTLRAECLTHARNLNHTNTLAYALWFAGSWLSSIVRDTQGVHQYGTELLELARDHRLNFWTGMGRMHVAINGYGKTRAEAVADAEEAVEVWKREHDGRVWLPEILCRIGEAYLDEGIASECERVLSEATDLMARSGEVLWESELYRLRGRLAAISLKHNPEAAVAEYERAISIAQGRNTKLLELRAATDFARLLAERVDRSSAKELLHPVYSSITGPVDIPDVVEAKAVLDELA
jgi:class 3 adenylate cyclase/tetratricopeptide (TPR) repeat protein